MNGRNSNRRDTGNKPRLAGAGAITAGKIASVGTHSDLLHIEQTRFQASADLPRLSVTKTLKNLKQQRTGGLTAGKSPVSRTIEITDPYRHHIGAGDADSPGIAKGVGGAGLPGDLQATLTLAGQ